MTTGAPTRVLFVNAGAERGGAEVVLLALLEHLDRGRFPPLACCLRDGPFVDELRQRAGIQVMVVPSGSFRQVVSGVNVVRRLRALVMERGVCVVHCNGTGALLYGGLAARFAGVPSVYHVHDTPERRWNAQGFVERAARLVPASVAVAPSSFLAAELMRCRVRPRRVVTIPNGMDAVPVPASESAASDRPRLASPEHVAPTAVWCGRLQAWKGAHVFIRAASTVRRTVTNARFVIVGGTLAGLEPDYPAELRSLVASLDLDAAVEFAGHQPQVGPYLDRADVVVHSAITPEPFGLVLLEAMFAGKPVVASAAGGPLEIVEPEVTGLLVPPDDAEALAGAMLRLLQDPELRGRLGEAGRARARRHFSATAMTTRFEALYTSLVGGAASSGAEAG